MQVGTRVVNKWSSLKWQLLLSSHYHRPYDEDCLNLRHNDDGELGFHHSWDEDPLDLHRNGGNRWRLLLSWLQIFFTSMVGNSTCVKLSSPAVLDDCGKAKHLEFDHPCWEKYMKEA